MPRLGLLGATLLVALSTAAPASAADTVPGEIIVRFKEGAGGTERAAARREAKVTVKRSLRLPGAQLLQTEPGQSVGRAVAALERQRNVVEAAPNWIATATAPAADPHFNLLWGLHNTAQFVDGVADADIDAPEAWDLFSQAPNVVVAVADTGVRDDHPDLDGNIWTNPGETANGVDDADPGALVDDLRGWDFIDHDSDPTDLAEHGTHVAGTIAAEGNNELGVTGVAWDAQILPVRVLDENGYGTGDAILDGFDYAGDMGAKVVNASLGGDGDASTAAFYADVMDDHPDTLFVVAAGNGGDDGVGDDNETAPQYPCNTPVANLVCVAATDHRDALASFSNFGAASVDVGAPGVSTYSTYPRVEGTGFADDFEASGMTGWVTTPSGAWGEFAFQDESFHPTAFLHESSPNGLAGDENLIVETAVGYDLAGRKGCVLGYDLFYELDAGKDELLVETSVNGGPWVERDSFTGTNGFVQEHFTNLHADGQPSVRLRFRTDADSTAGSPPHGAWFGSLIDNVRVTCQVAPDATSYGYMSGTSMAAPHVAGVATLLFGARPDADVAQVRTWLLTSGDPLGVLSAKTTSGLRLNAHRALLAATGAAGGPEAVTDAPTAITRTGATLIGRIDPNGVDTTYRFVYGTAPGALTSQTAEAPAGAGLAPVSVSQPITGLSPGTTYHFRLVAIQGGTETFGVVQSFTTTADAPVSLAPTVTSDAATDVGTTTAALSGTVNPNGKETVVLLEWGTASGVYTQQTNTLDVGSDTEAIALGVELTGLSPNRKYFFRLRATNAGGTASSPERSFTTLALPGTAGPAPTTTAIAPATPIGPTHTQGTPPIPPVSVTCKLTRAKKIACKAGATVPVKVSVRVFKGRRVVARGSAARLTMGRAIKMRTPRRLKRGRYKLQLTVTHNGAIVTTIRKTIRL